MDFRSLSKNSEIIIQKLKQERNSSLKFLNVPQKDSADIDGSSRTSSLNSNVSGDETIEKDVVVSS